MITILLIVATGFLPPSSSEDRQTRQNYQMCEHIRAAAMKTRKGDVLGQIESDDLVQYCDENRIAIPKPR